MRYFLLLILTTFSWSTWADYKCEMNLTSTSNPEKIIGTYKVWGLTSGYHSPTEVTLYVESDDAEKMSSILFYHTMDTEDGENNVSLSLVRQNVFWGKNQNYNSTKFQSLGRVILNGNESKTLNVENYQLKVSCLIVQ